MRYIALFVVLCFAMPPVSAVAAVKTVKIRAKRNKIKHQSSRKARNHSRSRSN